MCASYGLDPRFSDKEWIDVVDAATLDRLRAWAESNAGAMIRPTGIRAKNLNPLIQREGFTEAWWGHLVDGKAASYPSINSRIERLSTWTKPISTAIAPASYWREMQKPQKVWHHLEHSGDLLGLAAVTQPGIHADGTEYICYSLVMRPAASQIEAMHDRMPLLIGPGFADEWLTSTASAGELLDAARAASEPLSVKVTAHAQGQTETLF
ncbi:MAG TPA: SOS response-associated peptidase family protein [Terrimesophilobacter sp.]|nr:SOS response-associated peptidase family protein [Terrimesophilobacter sp.]